MCFVLNSLPRTWSHCRPRPESNSRCHARVVRTLQGQNWRRVAIGQGPGSAEGERHPVGRAPHSVILSLVRGLRLASGDHFLHPEGSHHHYSHSPQTSQSLCCREPPRQPPHMQLWAPQRPQDWEACAVFLIQPNGQGNCPSEPNYPRRSQDSTKSSTERTLHFYRCISETDMLGNGYVLKTAVDTSIFSSLESKLPCSSSQNFLSY